MNDKLKAMLASITESRNHKYAEEVERQKTTIEAALFKFLEARKDAVDKMSRATVSQQTCNSIWFQFELDADVLPEVSEYIDAEFGLKVDTNKPYKVHGEYEA